MCFNSLQTGKHIQSRFLHLCSFSRRWVSIPFKRESISKADEAETWDIIGSVSIPFKRESISKVHSDIIMDDVSKEFQFPSNGKAYPKKDYADFKSIRVCSFNSLQTGKHIQRVAAGNVKAHHPSLFQFPSNGKAYPKAVTESTSDDGVNRVSIPFKRESISKVNLKGTTTLTKSLVSIPFKRESISKEK